jgi:hypothetical protein
LSNTSLHKFWASVKNKLLIKEIKIAANNFFVLSYYCIQLLYAIKQCNKTSVAIFKNKKGKSNKQTNCISNLKILILSQTYSSEPAEFFFSVFSRIDGE